MVKLLIIISISFFVSLVVLLIYAIYNGIKTLETIKLLKDLEKTRRWCLKKIEERENRERHSIFV